tara:strand:- start:255 stop:650 length:396 start_codon:yes stop_codon:yes gene_type:complete
LIFIKTLFDRFFGKKKNNLIIFILILTNAITNISLAQFRFVNHLDADKLKICLRKSNFEECRKLIFVLEKLHNQASNQGNFKCQSTLLGIQTELIKNLYFENNDVVSESIIYSNLIKNCKFYNKGKNLQYH